MESFLPLPELLRIGIRNNQLLLESESAVGASASQLEELKDETYVQRLSRQNENAARLALLVTKSYISFLSEFSGEYGNSNSNNSNGEGEFCEEVLRHISSLQLGDFFASLDETTLKKRDNGDGGRAGSSASGEVSNENGHGENGTSSNSSNLIQKITLLGIELIAPARVSSPRDNHYEDQNEQQVTKQASSKQILGKLLHSVFSLDGDTPTTSYNDLFSEFNSSDQQEQQEGEPADDFEDKKFDYQHQLSKTFRSTDTTTLYSKLLESKSYPKSVCRFLADLIDPNNADPPFDSWEDVTRDLEQMVNYPQLFLHDPMAIICSTSTGAGIVPQTQQNQTPPVFGQVYHGRKEEIATLLGIAVQMEHGSGGGIGGTEEQGSTTKPSSGGSGSGGVEAVFISGKAGSGKSQLVHTIEDHLSCLGWIVTKAKFDRSTKQTSSRGIISSMFDKVIQALIKLKEGNNPCDVQYIERVSKSILDSIGKDGLSKLEVFLPSLPALFEDSNSSSGSRSVSPWKDVGDTIGNSILVFSLSKILEAVLEKDRYIMLCCDE